MSRRASCAQCETEVIASSARPVVRATGVVFVCRDCDGKGASASTRPARPAKAAKTTQPARGKARAKTVRHSTEVGVAPVPAPQPQQVVLEAEEPSDLGWPEQRALEAHDDDDDDYDALYVSIEDDVEDDDDDLSDYAAVAVAPSQSASDIEGVISGTDYASAAGSFEVTNPRKDRRLETTPPPRVVIGD